MYFNFGEDMLIDLLDTYCLLLSKEDKQYIKHIIMFLLRIFNTKIAFKLELRSSLQLGISYKANIKSLISECFSMNMTMQRNFWTLHSIITQK